HKALTEILRRCDRAGETKCVFAAGDPVANFETITRELRADPVELPDGAGGTITVPYAVFISAILGALYQVNAGEIVTQLAAEVWAAINGSTAALARRAQAAKATQRGYDFPYENGFEASSAVIC